MCFTEWLWLEHTNKDVKCRYVFLLTFKDSGLPELDSLSKVLTVLHPVTKEKKSLVSCRSPWRSQLMGLKECNIVRVFLIKTIILEEGDEKAKPQDPFLYLPEHDLRIQDLFKNIFTSTPIRS